MAAKKKKKAAKKKAAKKAKPKKKTGRPLIPLDWEQIEAMAKIQCTQTEIASVFSCCIDTLNKRCRREHGCTFSEYLREKGEGGKASLRRTMWKKALGGDRVMLIWVSKNVLGWKDKREHSGDQENPVNVKHTIAFGDKKIEF